MDTLDNMNEFPAESQPVPQASPLTQTPPESVPVASQPAPDLLQEHTGDPVWSAPGDLHTGYTQPQQPQQEPYRQATCQPAAYRQPAPQYRQVPPPTYYPPQTGARQPGYYQPRYQQVYTQPVAPMGTAPVPPAPARKKKKGGFWKGLVAAILIIALVAGSCCVTAAYVNRYWEKKTDEMNASFSNQIGQLQQQIYSGADSSLAVSGTYAPTGDTLTPAQVYAQNVQAVVAISSTVTSSYYGQTTEGTATGSGFIVTADGYVVTNYHVVEDASAIKVTTNNGATYEATLVGGDENNDVAVLKISGTNLPSVVIGSSDSLIVGDQVVAIGNPLGELTNTLTVGYVSAKDRAVTTDSFAINMIQTDAAINSGNSGGPLFNMYGQVVGITSAKYSGESSSGASIEGIGFAIPIDDVLDLIEALISDGYVSSGYLGVSVSDYEPSYASYYGLPESTPTGAIIREVVSGYSAARAGVQAGDVVVALGDYAVSGVTSLTRALRYYNAGETTTITVYRNGEQLTLSITLDEKPADTQTEESTEPETTESTNPGFSGFPGGGSSGRP